MGIDYLEAAKNQILAIEGEHPVEEVQVRSLTAIADVLIHMAMKDERTCRIDVIETSDENDEGVSYWQCTVCDETFGRRISDPFFPADFNYCPNCGAKVVE